MYVFKSRTTFMTDQGPLFSPHVDGRAWCTERYEYTVTGVSCHNTADRSAEIQPKKIFVCARFLCWKSKTRDRRNTTGRSHVQLI